MNPIANKFTRKANSGQEIIEWWLILTCVSLVVIVALLNWGGLLNTTLNNLNNTLSGVNANMNTST